MLLGNPLQMAYSHFPTMGAQPVADPGFYKGDFYKNESRDIFEAMPTFALTTPIFDRKWRVLCSPSRLRAASRPEFAQNR